MTQTVML